MITAEEFLQFHLEISYFYDDKTEKVVCYSDEVEQAMIEFAKLHVTAALKAASEKVDNVHGGDYFVETILTAYPLDLIK